MHTAPNIELRHHFIGGPFVEVIRASAPVLVEFWSEDDLQHAGTVTQGQWIRASRAYFSQWSIKVRNQLGDVIYTHEFDLEGQNVRVFLDSKSLGDTLAWVPQAQRFAEKHVDARVYVSSHWAQLIDENAYPDLTFIDPAAELSPCYATYAIGYYFDDIANRHPHDPRSKSLQSVASDILGLTEEEKRPHLVAGSELKLPSRPYVTIATTSTAACKHWLFPHGWQHLVNWLNQHGLDVMVIQKEPTDLQGVIDETGDSPIADRITQLANSKFFIGLASGLSWLAWAARTPVVMISGFSLPFTEFSGDCARVINRRVCHGCWNDTSHRFERDNWNWCPRAVNKAEQHECSRQITPEMVISAIRPLLG